MTCPPLPPALHRFATPVPPSRLPRVGTTIFTVMSALAAEPLSTYPPTVSGRSRIDAACAKARLKPNLALDASDADVIQSYVRLGMGVGLVAEMASKSGRKVSACSANRTTVPPASSMLGT